MRGKHLIIDMSAGDRERVQSAQHISRFAETLVETLGMKAYTAPLLEHFSEHLPEAAGYSLVQLIETSAITGHFCDLSGISTFFPARISMLSSLSKWFVPHSVRNTSTSSRSYAKPSRRAPATCSRRNTCLSRIEG